MSSASRAATGCRSARRTDGGRPPPVRRGSQAASRERDLARRRPACDLATRLRVVSARAAQPRRAARRAPRYRPRASTPRSSPPKIAEVDRRARRDLGAGAVLGRRLRRSVRAAVGARRSRPRRPTWARRSTRIADWVMQRGQEFVDRRSDARHARDRRRGRRGRRVSAELPRPPRRRARSALDRAAVDARAAAGAERCCARCACCSSRRRSRSTTRCC